MNPTHRQLFIAWVLITCIMTTLGFVAKAEVYPSAGIVTEIDEENDVVECTLFGNGYIYEFYGVEDWNVGDICAMIMDDNGTDEVDDDFITDAKYCGYLY